MVIMSITIFFFLFSFLSFFVLQHHTLADEESNDINWWCNTTPHPEPCKYFMGRNPEHSKPKSREDFRTMTIKVALERALYAQTGAQSLGQGCRSKRRLVAWWDCRNLIDDTIIQLNSTLQGIKTNDSFTDFDAQTWLSTALTYIETCRTGSLELNVSKFISPIVSGNVSELLSNSLAINGGLLDQAPEQTDEEFPSWVTSHERKLLTDLQLASRANVIVAKDGSGAFRSIQAAINYATSRRVGNGRVVIYIKRGVYRENIAISRTMNNVTLIGDGLSYTIITGSRRVSQGFTTYSSATVGVDGNGFIARGITFQNTAGPNNGQAVAFRSASDLSVFYACGFEGYQDTLFVHAQRQFYKTCYIYGTIDFIFGNAAVVFQNCIIYVRRPLVGQGNVITAQGRGDPFQNTGISIQNSQIMAAPDLKPVVSQFKTYLGRPWQEYSRTVILKSFIDSLVSPDGWQRWQDSNSSLSTLYYGEYNNFGPAADTRNRVKWPGYHVITSANGASPFTVSNLIAGRAWLPATGVPFTAGL